MKVIGCDCSTKLIGCSILEDNEIKTLTMYGGDANDFDGRFNVLFDLVKDFLKEEKPDSVYIEQAIYLNNVKVTIQIARIIDLVVFWCKYFKIPYQIVDNKAWKKDVIGSGKASKEEIATFVKTKWSNHKFGNQDECDATAIAFFGKRRLSA